jgi:hypothetical protein
VVAGCWSGDGTPETTRVAGIPVIRDAISAAGTPLGAGFKVPRGAVLVGGAVPVENAVVYRGRPRRDRGWTALMLATGDPQALLASVTDQAAAIGIRATTAGCFDGDALECSIAGEHIGGRTRSVSASIRRQRATTFNGPYSQLIVEYHDYATFRTTSSVYEGQTLPRHLRAPQVPRDWPALAGPGDTLIRIVGDTVGDLVVEPHTYLAAPLFSGGCTPSVVAVLIVDGEPRDVATAYSRQIESLGRPNEPDAKAHVRTRRDGRATVYEFNQTPHGATTFHGQLVEREGRVPWLVIEACRES